ncbi:MAG: flavodoxin-dependent (E)-4-hydroxy-3-methylbut-2-enyl-diphosphate synthase, partial [Caldimicrobium sp.]
MYPKIRRKKTRIVYVGSVGIGGNFPIRVQSMTNTDPKNAKATIKQIYELAQAGCEIVRVALPDEKAVNTLKDIVRESPIPVIGDLHFATTLGEKAIEAGIAGIRINPGTFKNKASLDRLIRLCKERNICLRIGINAGSLEKEVLNKYKTPSYKAMVKSAIKWVTYITEKFDFYNIKVSLKSSNWWETVKAYETFS